MDAVHSILVLHGTLASPIGLDVVKNPTRFCVHPTDIQDVDRAMACGDSSFRKGLKEGADQDIRNPRGRDNIGLNNGMGKVTVQQGSFRNVNMNRPIGPVIWRNFRVDHGSCDIVRARGSRFLPAVERTSNLRGCARKIKVDIPISNFNGAFDPDQIVRETVALYKVFKRIDAIRYLPYSLAHSPFRVIHDFIHIEKDHFLSILIQ